MDDSIYPNPIYQNLPPNKLTKGPQSFQQKLNTSMSPIFKDQVQIQISGNEYKENTQSISSSSSGDLIEMEFQEYQKALHNPNKAIRDEFTVTKKLKKKNKPPIKPIIINKTPSKPLQTLNTVQNPLETPPTILKRSKSAQNKSTNQQTCNVRIPNGHISSLTNFPLDSSIPLQNVRNHSFGLNSNFNSKSKIDPFDNNYIYNLDLNQTDLLNKPKLNIKGQSIVGASISQLRPQKMTTFEGKKNLSPTTRVNWIQFRANPVKKYKPYTPPISKEDQFLKKLMTKEGLIEARKKNEELILLRKQKEEDQRLTGFATNTICPPIEKATSTRKVKVISKTMALNDY